jgi:hypothetical protein
MVFLGFLVKEKNNYKVSACLFENTYLGVTGGYLKAGTSFLKRITGWIFRII